jgi:hypothetical protein
MKVGLEEGRKGGMVYFKEQWKWWQLSFIAFSSFLLPVTKQQVR